MIVQLQSPLVLQQEITSDAVLIHQTIDDATAQTVTCIVIVGVINGQNVYRTLTLWTGAEYVAIGQWTDTDAANRVKELLSQTNQ